jgi:hypothetical protein
MTATIEYGIVENTAFLLFIGSIFTIPPAHAFLPAIPKRRWPDKRSHETYRPLLPKKCTEK